MRKLKELNPLIQLIGLIFTILACVIAAIAIIPDYFGLFFPELHKSISSLSAQATPEPALDKFESTPDCASQIEIGPWTEIGNVLIDASDSWVQADFWSPRGIMKQGYDEVSTIFEPGLKVEVVGVQGNGWKYPRDWPQEHVEHCMNKHIQDSWDIRHKKLIYISIIELCQITTCK